jgi:hypothetical protein
MDQQLVIKLSEQTGSPIGLVESPPMLYTNLKMLFKQNVFSDIATATEVEPIGYGVFEWAWAPAASHYTKSIDDVGLTKHQDGIWRPTFVERNATSKEIAERTKHKKLEERYKRDDLLAKCDYTQLFDSGLSETKVMEYKAYRQALRDITLQEGFPWDVEFPFAPILSNEA